jgi:Uma2 family endonuclease
MAVEYRTEREYWERLDGVDYPKVSPKRTHALVQARLICMLRELAGERGEIGPEWKFRIGRADGTDSWLLPDVAYVSHERLHALPPKQREEPPFAPDIAVEVRSPGEREHLREEKLRRYLSAGATLVLDVDPDARVIRAHDVAGMQAFPSGDRFMNETIPWLAFDVALAFRDLDD